MVWSPGPESLEYSRNFKFAPCQMKRCMNIFIDDLGITSTKSVDVILESTNDKISTRQTPGIILINRVIACMYQRVIRFSVYRDMYPDHSQGS